MAMRQCFRINFKVITILQIFRRPIWNAHSLAAPTPKTPAGIRACTPSSLHANTYSYNLPWFQFPVIVESKRSYITGLNYPYIRLTLHGWLLHEQQSSVETEGLPNATLNTTVLGKITSVLPIQATTTTPTNLSNIPKYVHDHLRAWRDIYRPIISWTTSKKSPQWPSSSRAREVYGF